MESRSGRRGLFRAHMWSPTDSSFPFHLLPSPVAHSVPTRHTPLEVPRAFLPQGLCPGCSLHLKTFSPILRRVRFSFNPLGLCSNVSSPEAFDHHTILHPYLFIFLMAATAVLLLYCVWRSCYSAIRSACLPWLARHAAQGWDDNVGTSVPCVQETDVSIQSQFTFPLNSTGTCLFSNIRTIH